MMAGPTTGVLSSGLTAQGRVFRKQATAPIQNTVVGSPGTTTPTAPIATRPAPRLSIAQWAALERFGRDRIEPSTIALQCPTGPLRQRLDSGSVGAIQFP